MSRICPEYLDAHGFDLLTAGDVRFREEPNEEDDKKDEGDHEEQKRMTTKMAATQCDRVLVDRRGKR
jgi:hypothetical protein